MPFVLPTTKNPGDVLTSNAWNLQLRDSITKLLGQAHRVLTVAQFAALTGLEDGDEAYIEVDATNGIEWHVRYISAEPTWKWRFLGGPPMYSEVAPNEGFTNVAYAALATAGPSIALPRGGDYDVAIGATIGPGTTVANEGLMSYDIGGTGAVDADSIGQQQGSGTSNEFASVYRLRRKGGLTAVTLTAKYRSLLAATATSYQARFMAVTPVRII